MAAICKKTITEDGVKFDFVDGTTVEIALTEISEDMQKRAALHGLSQKVGDSYSKVESVEEAIGNAKAVVRNLIAGVWNTGGGGATGGKSVEALIRATGQPREVVLEKWAGMDKKARAAVMKHPDVKAAIAAIEAENALRLQKAAGESAPLVL